MPPQQPASETVVSSWFGSSSALCSSRRWGPFSGSCPRSGTACRENCAPPLARQDWLSRSRTCPRSMRARRNGSRPAGSRGTRRSIAWPIDSRLAVQCRARRPGCCSGQTARTATSQAGRRCRRLADCRSGKGRTGVTSRPSWTACRVVARPWKPMRAASVGTVGSASTGILRRRWWRAFERAWKRSVDCIGNSMQTRRKGRANAKLLQPQQLTGPETGVYMRRQTTTDGPLSG